MYIGLVAMSGLLQGGPYSEVTSVELRMRTRDNRETFLAITTCKLVFQVFTIFVMIFIGQAMQYSNFNVILGVRALFWVLLINTIATFGVHTWRTMKYGSITHPIADT